MTGADDWISRCTRRAPDRIAVIDVATDRRYTYAEFDDRVGRLAAHFVDGLRLDVGDRVATLMYNSTDCFEILFACQRAGVVFVPLNWRLTAAELADVALDMTPRLLIYDEEFAPVVAGVQDRHSSEFLLARESVDSSYERVIAASPAGPVKLRRGAPAAALLYTSGTTGRPKGALITSEMLFWNAQNISGPARLTCTSVTLVVLPTFHIGGLNLYALPTLHLGGSIVVQRRFDPDEALQLMADTSLGVTHFFGVPTSYLSFAEAPAFDDVDLTRLTTLGVGGAAPSTALLARYGRRGVRLYNGYGMTETGPVVITTGHDVPPTRDADVGTPVCAVDVRVVDAQGDDVAAGDIGELVVRGPAVSPGYWGSAPRHASDDGPAWFHTGDAARRDGDGRYHLVDRWKDMYITGGENVYPAEVENVISEISGVLEVAVVGVPDERWGERGVAAVVLDGRSSVSAADVVAHCGNRLAGYKRPASVVFIDELPHNSTGKVVKPRLRELLGTLAS